MTTLHVINLDTVGGVEELFVHFLENATHSHYIFVTGSHIHPHFRAICEQKAKKIIYEKRFGCIPLPKWMRQFAAKLRLRSLAFSKVVLWNRIEPVSKLDAIFCGKDIIYYEHGASWIEKKETNLAPFFSRVGQTLANSHAAKAVLQLKWNVSQPIEVIENPLRPDISGSEKRSSLHVPIRLGYIGRLIPLKAPLLVVETLRILHTMGIDSTLTIAGAGPEKQKMEKQIERNNLSKSCRFLGAIQDVSSFYSSIDILIVPSIREPLGLVAIEASAKGVPVIATAVDGLVEAVIHEETGLVIPPTLPVATITRYGGSQEKLPDQVYDPKNKELAEPKLLDPIQIAQAIEQLVKNPSIYTSLSAHGIVHAKKRADFKKYSRLLEEMIG